MKDASGDLAALACRNVIHEPNVQEGGDGVPALIANLGIKDQMYSSSRMRHCLICDCLSENPPSSHLLVFREIPF